MLHRTILRSHRRKYVKLFENTASFLLVVSAQALAIGVILAI
ncbi:hypothetical protein [Sphingomonas sp. MMS24-J13]